MTHIWTIIRLSQEITATFLVVYKKEMLTELCLSPHVGACSEKHDHFRSSMQVHSEHWDKPVGMDAWCVSLPTSVPWNLPCLTDSLLVCVCVFRGHVLLYTVGVCVCVCVCWDRRGVQRRNKQCFSISDTLCTVTAVALGCVTLTVGREPRWANSTC